MLIGKTNDEARILQSKLGKGFKATAIQDGIDVDQRLLKISKDYQAQKLFVAFTGNQIDLGEALAANQVPVFAYNNKQVEKHVARYIVTRQLVVKAHSSGENVLGEEDGVTKSKNSPFYIIQIQFLQKLVSELLSNHLAAVAA